MSQLTYLLAATIGVVSIGLTPQLSVGMSVAEVAKIAKGATVTIDSEASHGSGIIIQQQGNEYLVLTAAHVVRGNRNYEVMTADDRRYQLQPTAIQLIAGVDLAVVKFTSDRRYQVPKLGNADNSTEGTPIYVSGFPMGTETIDRLVFTFTDGKVTANSSKPLKDGYSIIYSNNTLPGMSGGGVFNDDGELVAIHGKGDVDTKINTSEINPNIRIKTGFNLGIPINTFRNVARRMGVNIGGAVAISKPSQSKPDDFVLAGFDRVSKRDLAGSIVEFSKAIDLNPKLVAARFWRGSCRLLMGDAKGAIVDYNTAIGLNPKKVESYIYRGSAYAKLGERAKAIADLDRAVSLAPKSDLTYSNRGGLKFQLNDFMGAIADYNTALKLNPNLTATFLVDRGVAKFQLGDRSGAVADYNRAISLDRSAPQAYYHRGLLKVELGDKPAGIVDLRTAAKLYLALKDNQNYQLTLAKIAQLQRG